MFKRIVNKTTELITKHPRLFSLAVGFAITLAVGTAIGMVEVQQAHAGVMSTLPSYASQHAFAHVPNTICSNCN